MRVSLLTSERPGVAASSGTAVALDNLVDALGRAGIAVAVHRPRHPLPLRTAERLRFNRGLRPSRIGDADAVLGVAGDGWLVAPRLPVPYVALPKAMYAEVRPHERGVARRLVAVQEAWERASSRAARLVVVPSRYTASAVQAHYGVEPGRIEVVPEPFDAAAWSAALPAREREPGVVLCVAHLYPRKRVDDLLDAWPIVLRSRPGARLRIAGHGPRLRHLRRRAHRLSRCEVLGHVTLDELRRLYATASLFVSPSAQENFGVAAVEALASGLPLVGVRSGALPELCDGGVARLTAPGDVEALAAGIVDLLDGGVETEAVATNPGLLAELDPGRVGARYRELLSRL